MGSVAVLDDPKAVAAVLDPLRSRVLAALGEPGSASTVAAELGLARQKVNYHVRALEDLGLVRLVEERPRRGLVERVVQATARSYAISPDALGDMAPDPTDGDRLSARYLIALAGRMIREVGRLGRAADNADVSLSTLSIDTEVHFASPADRAAFADDLAAALTEVVARHHHPAAENGRWYRLIAAAHPHPDQTREGPQ